MTDQVKEAVEDLKAEESLAAAATIPPQHGQPNGDSIELSSEEGAPATGAPTEAEDSAETADTHPERDRMSEQNETTEQSSEEQEQQLEETAPERDETTEAAESDTSTDTSEEDSSTEDDDAPADGTDWEAEAKKYKALLRKQEERAKTNFKKLEKAQAEGTATKAELEQLAQRVSAAEEKSAAAERKVLIATVAEETGLTTEQASRLRGKTKEALLNDADKIKKLFGLDKPAGETEPSPDPEPKKNGRPKEKLRSGASTEDDGPADDEIVDTVMKKTYGR